MTFTPEQSREVQEAIIARVKALETRKAEYFHAPTIAHYERKITALQEALAELQKEQP